MNCAITVYGRATLLANLARQFARFQPTYLGCNQTLSDHNEVQSAVRARTWVIAFAVRARDGEGGTTLRVVFLTDDDRRIKANLMSQQRRVQRHVFGMALTPHRHRAASNAYHTSFRLRNVHLH